MTSVVVVGSTGFVGSRILSNLLTLPTFGNVHTITRREPTSSSPKLHAIVSSDTQEWASKMSSIQPPPQIYFSSLGTTRAQAGGVEGQRLIDYDLNLSLAEAAQKAGAKIFVLISTAGANSGSMAAYMKMKGELEEAVEKIGYETTIILRPGMLLGDRGQGKDQGILVNTIQKLGSALPNAARDFWGQDADTVGRAAVNAAMEASAGKAPGKLWLLAQPDIVRLGRTDWKH